jgi:S1-C subfamily serine protease
MSREDAVRESSPAPEDGEKSLADLVIRTVPDLDDLRSRITSDPGAVIPPPSKVRALVGTAHLFGDQRPEQLTEEMERERQELLRFARMAVEAIGKGRGVHVPLTAEESRGAQAILTFVTRPALLVQDDKFVEPPPLWAEKLTRRRQRIQRTLPSVGRIEVDGHPRRIPWVGTGWVVRPGVVMTNRHVVEEFAEPEAGDETQTRWRIRPGMAARIDFGEEWPPSADEGRTYDVPGDALIRVYPERAYDLALVSVSQTARGSGARPFPAPLPIASNGDAITEGQPVYTVGYPARDPRSRELAAMYRLFDAIFDVKRLQPGQVMQVLPETNTALHDCSTLGGNSGSCVVDLETNQVIGLHYAGLHRHANLAIALWKLVDDRFLRDAGVTFYGRS